MPYCLYLRKSRSDVEAERAGEGETLSRHEHALLELARRQHLDVTEIYREIVSGETISARPVMQRLLTEVEDGLWTGVLVMEVERLARGDSIDQGTVSRAFTISHTKIITPMKVYDPDNEFDQEYFEFGLFMSRREYQTIRRRLNRGREASVKEGKYATSISPYGYDRKKLEHEKGWILVPNPTEAPAVRLIFQWYAHGAPMDDGTTERIGPSKIATRLDAQGFPTRTGKPWSKDTIRDMLTNPVYIGKLQWGRRKGTQHISYHTVKRSRPVAESYTVADGLHEPLIDQTLFDEVQTLIANNPPRKVSTIGKVANPLSGLVICSVCGRHMIRRPFNDKFRVDELLCPTRGCPTVSADLPDVEETVLQTLRGFVEKSTTQPSDQPANPSTGATASSVVSDDQSTIASLKEAIKRLQGEIDKLARQRDSIHDLLEQGVYDVDTFLSRGRAINDKMTATKEELSTAEKQLAEVKKRVLETADLIPQIAHVLELYPYLENPKEKNDLLKTVISKIVYAKPKKNPKGVHHGGFTINLFLKYDRH
ncbi:MAG: recombinase family protein [Faecousia sp.]